MHELLEKLSIHPDLYVLLNSDVLPQMQKKVVKRNMYSIYEKKNLLRHINMLQPLRFWVDDQFLKTCELKELNRKYPKGVKPILLYSGTETFCGGILDVIARSFQSRDLEILLSVGMMRQYMWCDLLV